MTTLNATTTDPAKQRRVELILRQIEALPTLPAVALKLLTLTTSDDASADEVIDLVRSDQAITARILSMAHRSNVGVAEVSGVDHAVKLLGFSAVRNAVLSQKIFETFQDDEPQPEDGQPRFDRTEYWRHCLAVGICAELIAKAHPGCGVDAGDAFVCGLLHDIGKVALDHVLPKAYIKIIDLVDLNQGNIAEFERRVIGIDHQTVGKRLAEQWQLPHVIQDAIWLHGGSYHHLPELPHRKLIGTVTLADLIVRRQHIGYSGNFIFNLDNEALARDLGFDPRKLRQVAEDTFSELQQRSVLIGMDESPSHELYIQSIQRANEELGRLNAALERRARLVDRQSKILAAMHEFFAAQTPGRTVQDQMQAVVACAIEVFGPGPYAMLHQADRGEPWLLCQYTSSGSNLQCEMLEPPANLAALITTDAEGADFAAYLDEVRDDLAGSMRRGARVMPLSCGWGVSALLIHCLPELPPRAELAALTHAWGSAIAAAQQHEGARRLGEQLAEANRELNETQDRLLRNASLVRLGEMASGAAHEMNNPLAVMSGRGQLLATRLTPGSEEHKAASAIVDQTQRLSDLISSLRMYADPPKAQRMATQLGPLLDEVVKDVKDDLPEYQKGLPFSMKVTCKPTPVQIDPPKLQAALRELLLNAVQAHPKSAVHLSARTDSSGELLVIQISDDGEGMDAATLEHAMDPFFSSKPAGRRVGMGLPRAQQLAAAHGGHIELRSQKGQGTVATLTIPLDSAD